MLTNTMPFILAGVSKLGKYACRTCNALPALWSSFVRVSKASTSFQVLSCEPSDIIRLYGICLSSSKRYAQTHACAATAIELYIRTI